LTAAAAWTPACSPFRYGRSSRPTTRAWWLTARIDPPELPAYGRLLLDVLNGNAALSIRGDEAEQAWRVVAPVLSAWSKDLVPMLEYPAGSQGPGGTSEALPDLPG
jgi:glucose-6-phosphate 1-dehydrogenase